MSKKRKLKKQYENLFCCKKCGGLNIEKKVWADVNTDTVLDNVSDGEYKDTWCRDCEDHTGIMLKTDWNLQNEK